MPEIRSVVNTSYIFMAKCDIKHHHGEHVNSLTHFYSLLVFTIKHLQTILTQTFRDSVFFIFIMTERVVGSLVM